ncbi:MFS transporter [Bacteroidota bacterium]
MAKKRSPWSFIPTQYFAEGLPYILVNNLSVAMYKSLEASNAFIGMTSFLYIPWSIKFLWGPYVDANKTKRRWVLLMQICLAILFGVIALGIQIPNALLISLVIFTLIAFISATHDIATDGFYLHVLNKKDQAFFTGIRSTFYRLSMIFGGGILVAVAGYFGDLSGAVTHGWSIAFFISAGIFLVMFLYHKWILPYPATDLPVRDTNKDISSIPFAKVFKEYFSQKSIGVILAYILLYRLGEGMLVKMAQPFLMDDASKGGLGISLSGVGIMYGTFGVIALVIGGILGGWLIKKYSLKKLIWIMAFAMNLPNLLYVYMAYFKPGTTLIQGCIIFEQFGYGLGFTAFMVYLLYISRGKFKTSHYAISTGIMALGMMLPGFISGFLQQQVGYLWLFILSFIFTIPGMLTIFFLPFYEKNEDGI